MNKSYTESLCISPIDIHSNLVYTIVVASERATGKEGLSMKLKEFIKLTPQQQKAYWDAHKKAATCSNK